MILGLAALFFGGRSGFMAYGVVGLTLQSLVRLSTLEFRDWGGP